MSTLTTKNVYAIPAPSSGGQFYALSGTTKAAREALAKEFGKPSPGGHHIVSEKKLKILLTQIRMGIAA